MISPTVVLSLYREAISEERFVFQSDTLVAHAHSESNFVECKKLEKCPLSLLVYVF